nr:uronyl 2-sulfotransferase-like [Lytechinus pictus]
MAAGMYKFRIALLLLASCSAVYFVIGPMAWTRKEKRSQTEITNKDTRAKPQSITYVKKVLQAPQQALQLTQREINHIKRSPVRPPIDLAVNPVVAVNVIETDNDRAKSGFIYDCDDDFRDIVESRHSVNGKPVYDKNKTVMYISMPKCGSRTFVWTAMRLRDIHHFGSTVNLEYMLGDNPPLKIRDFIDDRIEESDNGAIIHGHYRFIDMYGSPKKPILMSMLRDPVSRFESYFYFMRHGDKDISKEELVKQLGPRMALPNETLDDCIEKDRGDCTWPLYRNMYVTSFCGYDARCSQSPSFALEEAKRNVDKFLVIGVMEEYDLTMAVFEKLLPATFRGAEKIYVENKDQSIDKSKTNFKKPTSPKTYSILKQRMKYDYAFYDYVKKRLHRVAKELGIGSCSAPL